MSIKRESAGTKKAGQSVGGQFAATEKSQASGAGLGDFDELDAILAERTAQFERVAQLQSQLENQRIDLAVEMLSAKVEKLVGTHDSDGVEIVDVVLAFNDHSTEGNMVFSGLRRADGEMVNLADEHEMLSEYVRQLRLSEQSTPFEFTDPLTAENPYLNLVEPSLPSADKRPRPEYVDVQDEQAFNRALSDAVSDGRIIGSVRTRAQFEDEMRAHLSDTVNELNTEDRETFFDDGNIDAWVDEAIDHYEHNKPDERDDAMAFRDAIEAGNPHDH